MDMSTLREAVTDQDGWRLVHLVDRATQPLQMAACGGIVERRGETTTVSLDSHDYLAVYDPEVSISLVWGLHSQASDARPDPSDLTEPWSSTGGFPDPTVHYSYAELRWNGQPVDQVALVNVDGGRGYLPAPMPYNPTSTMGTFDPVQTVYSVSSWASNVARLVDGLSGHRDFDSHLRRAGFLINTSSQ